MPRRPRGWQSRPAPLVLSKGELERQFQEAILLWMVVGDCPAPDFFWLAAVQLFEEMERRFPRVERPRFPALRFDFNTLGDAECLANFRMNREELETLLFELRLPDTINVPHQGNVPSFLLLLVVLRRMALPDRLQDMSHLFYRDPTTLSRLFAAGVHVIFVTYSSRMGLSLSLVLPRLRMYADAVQRRLDVIHKSRFELPPIWGFVDGHLVRIARPSVGGEWHLYNGRKSAHFLNFQGIVAPDGLIVDFFGPVVGSTHDISMLQQSRVLQKLQGRRDVFGQFDGSQQFCLIGDQGYVNSQFLITPFRAPPGGVLSRDFQTFNRVVSRVRVSVEMAFGKLTNTFAHQTYWRKLQLYRTNPGRVCRTAAFLVNCIVCIRGRHSNIFEVFRVPPPSLAEYLQSVRENEMNIYGA